jgi:hypothetical protein
MKSLTSKIEAIRARMIELNETAKQSHLLIPKLEHEIHDLKSRKGTIGETLDSLVSRRDKVLYLCNKLN